MLRQIRDKMHRHSVIEFELTKKLTGTEFGEVVSAKLLLTATAKIGINYLQVTCLLLLLFLPFVLLLLLLLLMMLLLM